MLQIEKYHFIVIFIYNCFVTYWVEYTITSSFFNIALLVSNSWELLAHVFSLFLLGYLTFCYQVLRALSILMADIL